MKALISLSLFTTTLLSTSLLSSPALAGEADSFSDAITGGDIYLKLRYRLELVDQDGFSNTATASTLRTVLGYKTASYKGFSGVLEFENVSAIGNDSYNSTINGKTNYPIVADPKATEVNQAYLRYTGFKNTEIYGGRREFKLANQRVVGSVPWRQNHQTLDMVGITGDITDDFQLNYGYVWNINRVLGDDHPLGNLDAQTHIASLDYAGLSIGKINAYAVLSDLVDVQALSTQTFGASLSGDYKTQSDVKLSYRAEYARQSDYADNPANFNADYYHVFGSAAKGGFSGKIGFEHLGTDNGRGFSTPFATLHIFNGWADKFISTPDTGLDDLYASLSYTGGKQGILKGLKLAAIYHDFSAASDGHYGSEIDLLAAKKINKHFYAGLKYANYNADEYATDTQKIWFTIGANY